MNPAADRALPGMPPPPPLPLSSTAAAWHGPGAPARVGRGWDWTALLWWLVYPPRRHRVAMTLPGLLLMLLAVGIGTAAYNTASNILFLTLALLLACLLLSGLLSWVNFRGVSWRLQPGGPWRAGHEATVTVEVRNAKAWLPTYGLWFELTARPRRALEEAGGAADGKVRAVLAAAEREVARGRRALRERLEPGGGATVEWGHRPARRGEAVVELAGVGSLFPFGFLQKSLRAGPRPVVVVWPAQVDYQWRGAAAARLGATGRRLPRTGRGEELLALRAYAPGDAHGLIHWKASARAGRMLVRQFAAESVEGFGLVLDTPAEAWPRPEQFERLCSFAGTLAEDLFAAGRLHGVQFNGGPWLATRRVRDLEEVLDRLARLAPGADPIGAGRAGGTPPAGARHRITFVPEGGRGVTALLHGEPAATA